MVDYARIQNRIYYGYGKAAIRLGTTNSIYRSSNGINPIQSGNLIGAQLIGFDQDYKYTKARKYGDMTWQFLPQNGLALEVYDYLVGSEFTYFIVDVIPDGRLSPPLCVECNDSISIFSPSNAPLVAGSNPIQQFTNYGATLVQNAPVALLEHTRFDTNNLKLPTSVKLPMYEITMPDFDDIEIMPGHFLIDSIGRRMVIISAEQTKKSLGFRLIAAQQGV